MNSLKKRYRQIVTLTKLMITLRLTLSELEHLRHVLGTRPQADATQSALLSKLDEAQRESTLQRSCPVCGTTFTQLRSGRIAQYCSAACKQKAYRQRCDRALRRHHPPYTSS